MSKRADVTLLRDARPGSVVNILVVVLGTSGPITFHSKHHDTQGYYTDLRVADSSYPTGVLLKFWGSSILSVTGLRPMLPVLFTGLSCKDPGVRFAASAATSLVWLNHSSAVVTDPPPSEALKILSAWSEDTLGSLPGAARAGQAAISIALPPRCASEPPRPPPGASGASGASVAEEGRPSKRMALAAEGNHGKLANEANGGSMFFSRARFLEARFPKPKRQMSLGVLNARVIQGLVTSSCRGASRPHAHCAHCAEKAYRPFHVRLLADGAEGEGEWCVVRGRAAERVFLGARARDVEEDEERAAFAAEAVRDLVREEGPFGVLLKAVAGGGQGGGGEGGGGDTALEGSLEICGQKVSRELVDLFV